MHGLADPLVARNEKDRFETPRKYARAVFFANLPRLDEIDAVIVMFVDARRDRENIRIEDDVLGESRRLSSESHRRASKSRPCVRAYRLGPFIEGHHDDGAP